jgi:hypothetical protein
MRRKRPKGCEGEYLRIKQECLLFLSEVGSLVRLAYRHEGVRLLNY